MSAPVRSTLAAVAAAAATDDDDSLFLRDLPCVCVCVCFSVRAAVLVEISWILSSEQFRKIKLTICLCVVKFYDGVVCVLCDRILSKFETPDFRNTLSTSEQDGKKPQSSSML